MKQPNQRIGALLLSCLFATLLLSSFPRMIKFSIKKGGKQKINTFNRKRGKKNYHHKFTTSTPGFKLPIRDRKCMIR